MDQGFFDRIATALGAATSRRAGIAAALGAALGFGLGPTPASSRRPGTAGPCGDGSRTANRCRRNSDCCTNICNPATGDTNRDTDGRCRCVRRNGACREDRNCCNRKGQGLVCRDSICTDPCTSLGAACTANSTCCAGTCGGSQPAARDRAASRTCCLDLQQSGCTKDADCCGSSSGDIACVAGVCASTCLALGASCTDADSCCAGACTLIEQNLERGDSTSGTSICCIALNSGGCTQNADCCTGGAPIVCDGGQCVFECSCPGAGSASASGSAQTPCGC